MRKPAATRAIEVPAIEVPGPVAGRLIVAFSGGLDSTVLLHRLASQDLRARVLAAHVHHGLQPAADGWAAQAQARCATLGVPFELLRVRVNPADGGGPEAAARAARYAALRGLMRPGDALVTAHQRDDQAETVLLRLLRGTGVDGLAAMQPLCAFACGWLWRPLLDEPREALREYAQRHGLSWIEDPHNDDPRYARSWLRREVLPLLRTHFPQARDSLARTAVLAAEAAGMLAELAAMDLREARLGDALRIEALLGLSAGRRRNALRHWLRGRGFGVPGAEALGRIERELLTAAADAEPLLAWPGVELRRYREWLYAMAPLPPAPTGQALHWSGAALVLPAGCGELRRAAPAAAPLKVRFPAGGERFRPRGAAHHRTLKNLFQEAGVPPWVRQRTPLVEQDGALVYIAGLGPGAGWDGGEVEWLGAPAGTPTG
ncbi:MAG: tRNA lysidine(34) synthetase TilS [Nevskia sp.]|nr:tRNA lysidine(34) synthetase TilS [Nevskia sp.]